VERKQREHFQGSREWLFEEVREWVRGTNEEGEVKSSSSVSPSTARSMTKNTTSKTTKRVCWLVGGAGTGKSVVSAQLLATAGIREHIKAWHFCRHDNAANSDASDLSVVGSMLTCSLPHFRVEERDVSKALATSDAAEMFELLLATPLKRAAGARQEEREEMKGKQLSGCGGGGGADIKDVENPHSCNLNINHEHSRKTQHQLQHQPCVIVLDAIDELPRDSLEAVLHVIADKFGELPSFVRLFIAVRDQNLSRTPCWLFSLYVCVCVCVCVCCFKNSRKKMERK